MLLNIIKNESLLKKALFYSQNESNKPYDKQSEKFNVFF